MSLKTDYTNDIFSGNRKYNMITNSDGTVSFTDVTEYTSEGDTFSASDINSVNEVINALDTKIGSSTLETAAQDLSDAVNEVNSNKAPTSHASTGTSYGKGDPNNYGHVKLSDAIGESFNSGDGYAATPLAAKKAYDKAASAYSLAEGRAPQSHASTGTTYGKATSSSYGHARLSDSHTSTSDANGGIAATPKAAKDAYDHANTAAINISKFETSGRSAFTKYPADWLENSGRDGFNFSTVCPTTTDQYAPTTTGSRWYNVYTFGTDNRCTQIAYFGYLGQGYNNGMWIRTQHDTNVSAWTRIPSMTVSGTTLNITL